MAAGAASAPATFGARASDAGRDELAALAAAFNPMALDLARATRGSRLADRTPRQLLADVSHELMTPLTAMRGYLETLSMPRAGARRADARALSAASSATRRSGSSASSAICSIWRGSKAAADRCVRETCAVADLFDACAARHEREREAERRHAGDVDRAGRRDRRRRSAIGWSRRCRTWRPTRCAMRRPEATVELAARVGAASDASCRSRDTGPGIPPEHLPHVFDRFYKADPRATGELAGGSGLGLSIVKAIVERHGGTVSVSSDPGVATVFTVRLPVGMETGQSSVVSRQSSVVSH